MVLSVFFARKRRSWVDLGLLEDVATHNRHVETTVKVLNSKLVGLLHDVVGFVFKVQLTFFVLLDGFSEGGLVEGKTLIGKRDGAGLKLVKLQMLFGTREAEGLYELFSIPHGDFRSSLGFQIGPFVRLLTLHDVV